MCAASMSGIKRTFVFLCLPRMIHHSLAFCSAFEQDGSTMPPKSRLARLSLERDENYTGRGNRVFASKWKLVSAYARLLSDLCAVLQKGGSTIKCDECDASIRGKYAQCTVCKVVPPARGQYEICGRCLDQSESSDFLRLF